MTMTMTDDELTARVAEARAKYEALSPVDRAIADMEQRLSGVFGLLPHDSRTTKDELRAHMPEFILIDEIVRLRAELAHFMDCSYDATGDEIATLRRALCNAGIAGPESDEALGLNFVRYAKQVISYVARQSSHIAAMP